MNNLNFNGVIEYMNQEVPFSFHKGTLTILSSYPTHSDKNEKRQIIELLIGKTLYSSGVLFLNLTPKLYNHPGHPEFDVEAVVVSNSHTFNDTVKINSITLEKGTLNGFGDIYEEIFESHHYDIRGEDFDGVFKFQTKPFCKTNQEFVDSKLGREHVYSFAIHRYTPINTKTLNKIYRIFRYKDTEGFSITESIDKIIDMLNFIKLISWNKTASVESIKIGHINTDGYLRDFATLYCNLEKWNGVNCNVSIRDYYSNPAAFSNMINISKMITDSHTFLLDDNHSRTNFDLTQVLNTVISFEQLLELFGIKKEKMTPEEKSFRRKILNENSEFLNFPNFKEHIDNYRGGKIKETLSRILIERPTLVSNLITKSSVFKNNNDIEAILYKLIDIRNIIVHSGDYNINFENVGNGIIALTYINYYLILEHSGFNDVESTNILNKLVKDF